MDSLALQSLPLSVRKHILSLVETGGTPGADAEATPGPAEDSDALSARRKRPTSRKSLQEKIQSSLLCGQQLCVRGGWLAPDELRNARKDAERLLEASGRPAGMGEGSAASPATSSGRSTKWMDVQVRGDIMLWLPSEPRQQQQQHREDNSAGERDKSEALGALTDSLRTLRETLLSAGVNVGGRVSFQLASYQGRGERYVRHSDRSESCPLRRITAIVYLNPEWDAQVDGGQLLVYSGKKLSGAEHQDHEDDEATDRADVVTPKGGSIVVFDSGLEHEVLPCFAPRVALTAWFSCTEGPAAAHGLLLQSKEAEEPVPGGAPSPLAPDPYPTWSGASLLQHRGPDATGCSDGNWDTGNGLIFVSVVSFRDPETAWTVRSLFEAAEAPERLRVGIVWQADAAEMDANMKLLEGEPWRPQVREFRLHWREATGPCRARHLARSLWAGEEFFLQIDSHMRFCQGWDRDLLDWMVAAEAMSSHGRAVISTYPPGYEGEGSSAKLPTDCRPTLLCASHFGPEGLLRIRARRLIQSHGGCTDSSSSDEPIPSLFWAAGFSFSRAAVLADAPYSPHLPLLFFGEEMLQLALMWTHGWDVFAPPRTVVFHLWSRRHRPTFSSTIPQDPETKAASQGAVRALLAASSTPFATPSTEEEYLQNLPDSPTFRLGTTRTMDEFRRHCGVDFGAREIAAWAALGGEGRAEESFCE